MWTEEELLIDLPPGVLAVNDISAMDDERAVAVGSFTEQREKRPLILERDENGWKRRELTDVECGELISVAISAPDDAVALCETPTQFLGYRFDGATWSPFRNPLELLAPMMSWFNLSAAGPGSYLIVGGWIPEWRAVLLEWTGNRFSVVPGAWNTIYIYEVAAVEGELFAASCGAHMPECVIFRVSEPEWIEEALVPGLVTGFSRSPGGQWYASAHAGNRFSILRRIDSRWIPLLGAPDADTLELGQFNDIDAPRDDLVVAVGEKYTDRHRSSAAMYDGRTWRTLDAITGIGSLEWLAVSYVR
ncbi:MAG: hypothetical protein KJ042_04290 [Deltaproteobacteria bacterium]|nr:hypothetical protein [Deltaproteobacteria bacterium]